MAGNRGNRCNRCNSGGRFRIHGKNHFFLVIHVGFFIDMTIFHGIHGKTTFFFINFTIKYGSNGKITVRWMIKVTTTSTTITTSTTTTTTPLF